MEKAGGSVIIPRAAMVMSTGTREHRRGRRR